MRKMTYVGMDVHMNWIVAVWMEAHGRMESRSVTNDESGWKELEGAVGSEEVMAAYEASSCGFEVYDEFTKRGWKVWVLAPTHLGQSVRGRKTKTDLRDAKKLMDVVMAYGELGTGLPKVWVPGTEVREDREIVRQRLALAEGMTEVKNRITSLLRIHRVKKPETMKSLWTKKHVAWLRGLGTGKSVLGESVRKVVSSLVRELEFYEKEIEELNGEVEALSRKAAYEKPVAKMTEISGVGTLTAMTYLLEIGDAGRFKNRRQIASYLGLVPTSYESGEASNRKGHITRMGPARVRKVLNQAAWALLRENETWRAWYEQVAYRRGKKKAIVGVMRRLGIELWQRARTA